MVCSFDGNLVDGDIQADDRIESLTRELQATRSIVRDGEQHTIRLNEESENVSSLIEKQMPCSPVS
jgi:hypothetical protein